MVHFHPRVERKSISALCRTSIWSFCHNLKFGLYKNYSWSVTKFEAFTAVELFQKVLNLTRGAKSRTGANQWTNFLRSLIIFSLLLVLKRAGFFLYCWRNSRKCIWLHSKKPQEKKYKKQAKTLPWSEAVQTNWSIQSNLGSPSNFGLKGMLFIGPLLLAKSWSSIDGVVPRFQADHLVSATWRANITTLWQIESTLPNSSVVSWMDILLGNYSQNISLTLSCNLLERINSMGGQWADQTCAPFFINCFKLENMVTW